MIIPMLCVTIFVILVVWFLLPRVARLMIHTPTAISIFVCLSMVQLVAVFISMRCTLCGHRSEERFSRNAETDLVCRLLLEKKKKNKRTSKSTTTYILIESRAGNDVSITPVTHTCVTHVTVIGATSSM